MAGSSFFSVLWFPAALFCASLFPCSGYFFSVSCCVVCSMRYSRHVQLYSWRLFVYSSLSMDILLTVVLDNIFTHVLQKFSLQAMESVSTNHKSPSISPKKTQLCSTA